MRGISGVNSFCVPIYPEIVMLRDTRVTLEWREVKQERSRAHKGRFKQVIFVVYLVENTHIHSLYRTELVSATTVTDDAISTDPNPHSPPLQPRSTRPSKFLLPPGIPFTSKRAKRDTPLAPSPFGWSTAVDHPTSIIIDIDICQAVYT